MGGVQFGRQSLEKSASEKEEKVVFNILIILQHKISQAVTIELVLQHPKGCSLMVKSMKNVKNNFRTFFLTNVVTHDCFTSLYKT